jgi:hypothetical protein
MAMKLFSGGIVLLEVTQTFHEHDTIHHTKHTAVKKI